MMKQSSENEMDILWDIIKDKLSADWTKKLDNAGVTRLDPVPSISLAKYFDLWSVFIKTSKGFRKGKGHDQYYVMGQLPDFIEVSPNPEATEAAERLKDRECFIKHVLPYHEFSTSTVIAPSELKEKSSEIFNGLSIALNHHKYRTLLPVYGKTTSCLDEVKKLNIPTLLGNAFYIIDFVILANVEVNLSKKDQRKILNTDKQIPVAFSYHKYKVNSKDAISGPTIALFNAKKTNGIFEVAEDFKKKGVKPDLEIDQGKLKCMVEEPKEESQNGCCGCIIL